MCPPKFVPSATLAALDRRAKLLRRLREFFWDRGFTEVETPLLAPEVIPELHIEPIAVGDPRRLNLSDSPDTFRDITHWWLQASPELHMKRLLAAGATAIFQVTRSFRAGERGQLHNPEFTIVEWYRTGDDLQTGIEFLDELQQSLVTTPPARRTTYSDAFQRAIGICPHTASIAELKEVADRFGISVPAAMDRADRDEWLNLLLATRIEPQLGSDRPEIVFHYPFSQASLAKVVTGPVGYDVAERFELYYHGVELANGFHELTDAKELRNRLENVNTARIAAGRRALPLPEQLLATMEHGLPECTGCALGFDRLVMLALGMTSLSDATAFSLQTDDTG
jgi:lysyl-tRNA synthetase class 2